MRFQGFTPTPQYRPSATSRLWPARPAALCLPDPCGLGSDSHGGNVFSGKLLEFLTQTGSASLTLPETDPQRRQAMAKGEKRGNREAKKPKKEKPKGAAPISPFASQAKGSAPGKPPGGKR